MLQFEVGMLCNACEVLGSNKYSTMEKDGTMTIKEAIKSVVPQPIRNQMRRMKDVVRLSQASRVQAKRFRRWMSREDSTDKVRVETRLAFDIHRLEKGLSHVSFRYGFGKSVLKEIAKRMVMLEKADSAYDINPLYLQGLAAVGEYKRRHAKADNDLSEVAALFSERIWRQADVAAETHLAGSFIMDTAGKRDNLGTGFVELAEQRYSVREYSTEPVSQDVLDKVYEVAMKTPSVCNRQATRVYQITDPGKVKAALDIQGGFHGYAMPPVLLLVTSDIRAFMNENERNEPFTDGGLFSMSLLYALEAYGLAACPLNAMFDLSQEQRTRTLLDIPDNEFLIMYIAVGNFPDTVPVCRSTRKTADSVVTKI